MSGAGAVFLAALISIPGCAAPPDLLVVLRTDLAPRAEFDQVVVTMGGVGVVHEAAPRGYADGVPVMEVQDLDAGVYELTLTVMRGGAAVLSRPVIVDLARSRVVTVVVTRDCRGVSCPAPGGDATAAACLGSSCVDVACSEENGASCGDAACASDGDCPVSGASCATARCSAGACLYEDNGSCGADFFCAPEAGCRDVPDAATTPGTVTISALSSIWMTPNQIRWGWTTEGVAEDFVELRIEIGAAAEEIRAGAPRVVTWTENPELGSFRIGAYGRTVQTTTFDHPPDSDVFARVVVIDGLGGRSESEIISVHTPPVPVDSFLIFADDETPGFSLPESLARTTTNPFEGTHAYEYTQTCGGGADECWENLRRQGLGIDLSTITDARLDTAYVEWSEQISPPGAHALWAGVRFMFAGSSTHVGYEGWAARADGAYRTYQIPLRRLGVTVEMLGASNLREFGVGASWPVGATIRWDEVRIFY